MACKTCNQKFQGVCDACSLVDSDNTFKEVIYCDTCDAYICKKCQNNWLKRAIAYFIEKCHIKNKPDQPIVEITPQGNTYIVGDPSKTITVPIDAKMEITDQPQIVPSMLALKNIKSKAAEGFPNEETV